MNTLKEVREKHGISQEKLAQKIGVSHMTIYRAERDNKIKLEYARLIAQELNLNPEIMAEIWGNYEPTS